MDGENRNEVLKDILMWIDSTDTHAKNTRMRPLTISTTRQAHRLFCFFLFLCSRISGRAYSVKNRASRMGYCLHPRKRTGTISFFFKIAILVRLER